MEKCNKCNTFVDYVVIEKSNQHTAYCANCGSYIKNIPHTKTNVHLAMPFGKYKGIEINKITDKDYLSWALNNMDSLKEKFLDAIYNRIQEL